MISLLRWSARIAGLGALVLGLARITGAIHMTLGGIVAAVLAILAVAAFSVKLRVPLAGLALVWAAGTVYVGIRQAQWMTGNSRLPVEILHVLLGIGAIGLAEALAGAITRQRA